MCGILFLEQLQGTEISREGFARSLDRQCWRGPDAQHVQSVNGGRFLLGHNRLSIIDPAPRSDQPMVSRDGRFLIVYNGETYNHMEIRSTLGLEFATTSDTETILEGYALLGDRIFELMDGMFALVILDRANGTWVAARDPFGIKPLFIHRGSRLVILGSEPAVVAGMAGSSPCPEAMAEWKIIRRPIPGHTFFLGVDEVAPGLVVHSSGESHRHWNFAQSGEPFSQERFEELLSDSIRKHELSNVENVSLLSAGLDSAVITAVSSVTRSYSIGMPHNHEFEGAADTAAVLGRTLQKVTITPQELREAWVKLTRMRGEPLSLPNEGLIYSVCKEMAPMEKVVLTGEGADELLFGYDGIFRWSLTEPWRGLEDFLVRYGYAEKPVPTPRMIEYFDALRAGKNNVEFLEDLFYQLHLPGLLRRMDFSSMAASKEARVPFVSKALIQYMYRRPHQIKIVGEESKLPLRIFARHLGLHGALARKKIGFSAQIDEANTRYQEYDVFQNIVLGALSW